MSEIDRERLLVVKHWTEKEIERIQRHRANRPMYQGMLDSTKHLVTRTIPDMRAGPAATFRESVLKLEKSLSESNEGHTRAEEERQRRLARARARTDALRDWLEALS